MLRAASVARTVVVELCDDGRLGRHRGPRRAREQPARHQPRHTQTPADRVHRCLRLGQELAGLSDDRGRVPSAAERDICVVRAVVHGFAGTPGRRLAGRPYDRDRRRPRTSRDKPALNSRHGHGRIRAAAHHLFASGRAARRAANRVLVQRAVRARGWISDGRPRRGPDDRARPQRVGWDVPALRGLRLGQ